MQKILIYISSSQLPVKKASVTAVVALLATAAYPLLPLLRGGRRPSRLCAQLVSPPRATTTPARRVYQPRRWAVVGATGFIGSAIVEELGRHGLDVVPVPSPRIRLDPCISDGADVIATAEREPSLESLRDAFEGVDVVVNAAGLATPDSPATAELYGANALLPAVIALAARSAGVTRVLHLSSAAVQGRREVLDESSEVAPFSPYSRSKALGEGALLTLAVNRPSGLDPDLVIVRATSVQGTGRDTTQELKRFAGSPLATVAKPGTQPTVVSSLPGLVSFVYRVGAETAPVSTILLQPWEGLTVSDVLRLAGGREPRRLPSWACHTVVASGRAVGRVVPEVAGIVRRLELMWFGQAQVPGSLAAVSDERNAWLATILGGARS